MHKYVLLQLEREDEKAKQENKMDRLKHPIDHLMNALKKRRKKG